MVSLVIILTVIILGESDTIDFKFERKCWFCKLHHMLGFYFIPAVVSYSLCFVCLCIVLVSINKKRSEVRQALNQNGKPKTDLLKIGINLLLILGITEIIGLIQIKSLSLSHDERIVNITFGLIYDFLKSFRGVIIFIVFMVNKKTFKLLKADSKKSNDIHKL